jgi:hypothetical protein
MPVPKRMTGFCRLTAVLATVLLLAGAAGCGRKLPPIQPGTYPPPAVKNLAFEEQDGELTLFWTAPAVRNQQESPAVGFKVLRARQTLSEAECQSCTVRFEVIGDVRVVSKEPAERMQFKDRLESGYKYRYKVRGVSASGAEAKDSNVVFPNP